MTSDWLDLNNLGSFDVFKHKGVAILSRIHIKHSTADMLGQANILRLAHAPCADSRQRF